jgi:hypothetical protein
MSERREYEVYYESELSLGIAIGPEVIPHGAEVFSVREVLDGDVKRERLIQELLDASKDCLELLEDWFPSMDDMRCWTEVDSKKIDRLKQAREDLAGDDDREKQIQELLDTIDSDFDMGKFATWKLKVLEAREALR